MRHRQLNQQVRILRGQGGGGDERRTGCRIILELILETTQRATNPAVLGSLFDGPTEVIQRRRPILAGVVNISRFKMASSSDSWSGWVVKLGLPVDGAEQVFMGSGAYAAAEAPFRQREQTPTAVGFNAIHTPGCLAMAMPCIRQLEPRRCQWKRLPIKTRC